MALPLLSRRRKTGIAAFTILALLVSTGYALWEWPAWQASKETRQALAAGHFDEARRAVDRWLQLRPHSAEAHFFKAKTAIALGRRNDLADGLKQAEQLGCPADRLALLWALIDAQAGRLDQARPVLIRAFNETVEPDLMVDEALSRVLMELYDWPKAAAVLTKWAEHAPGDARPPLWRAAVHRRRDSDPEVIVADFREALKRDPKLLEARLGLAEELARTGRHAEAEPEFVDYLAHKSDNAVGFLGAGRNSLELGDLDTARQRFDRALALDSENGEVHIELAKFARLQGDETAALAHLDKAVALRPYDPAPHYNRRLALVRLKRIDEAKKEQERIDFLKADLDGMNDLRERLNASPNDANLQSRLALWMFTHGFDREGLQWSRKILNEHPRHRETCTLLARYYETKGDLELARYYQSQLGPPARR
jgi:tetratricopeptide (TPR) repeat protein